MLHRPYFSFSSLYNKLWFLKHECGNSQRNFGNSTANSMDPSEFCYCSYDKYNEIVVTRLYFSIIKTLKILLKKKKFLFCMLCMQLRGEISSAANCHIPAMKSKLLMWAEKYNQALKCFLICVFKLSHLVPDNYIIFCSTCPRSQIAAWCWHYFLSHVIRQGSLTFFFHCIYYLISFLPIKKKPTHLCFLYQMLQ